MKLKWDEWQNKVYKENYEKCVDVEKRAEQEDKVERNYRAEQFAGVKFIKVVSYSVAKSSQLV